METPKITQLYDAEYAKVYDEQFIYDPGYQHVADFEVFILSKLLTAGVRWLDVGCGTGYFLSKFPGVDRAGLDLSPDMLSVARKRNPEAMFLSEGDFRSARPEWSEKWDLVSCMWCAYCYVESMTDIHRVINNLCAWTAPRGVCFLPICDLEDVLYRRGELRHVNPDFQIFGGCSYVNGVVWSYFDSKHNKFHENLISPHIEYLIRLLQESFERVDVLYYPPYPDPIPGQRKALIATGKEGISPEIGSILDSILERSRANKANVLTIEQLANISRSKSSGWLRKLWRASPKPFQQIVRKILGEN